MKNAPLKRIFAGMTSLAIMSTLAVGTSAAGLGATLSAPKIESYKCNESAIRINWSKVKGATGYRVYRYSGGRWKAVGTVKGAATLSYKNSGLKAGTKYKFKVKAYKKSSSGKVTWSKASAAFTGKTKTLNRSKVMAAYKKVLEGYDSIWNFYLQDIDNDKIPELFIMGEGVCMGLAYSYYNGNAHLFTDCWTDIDSYYPTKGVLVTYSGSGAGAGYLYFLLRSGVCPKFLGVHEEQMNDSGSGYDSLYYWNSKNISSEKLLGYGYLNKFKKVTKSVYKSKIKSYVGTGKKVLVIGAENSAYDPNNVWNWISNTKQNRIKYLK